MIYALYFVVGFIFDLLITLDTQFIISKRVGGTFVSSVLITLISVLVVVNLVLSSDVLLPTICYAVGSGCGASLMVWLKKKKNGKKKEPNGESSIWLG